MKKRILLALDLLFDSLGYILITYLLSSAALSFRTSYITVLFGTARLAFLGLYLDRVKKKTSRKLLPYLALVLCFLIHIALMYCLGYLNMTLTPFS